MTQIYQGLINENATAVTSGLNVVWTHVFYSARDGADFRPDALGTVWPSGNATGDPSDGIQVDYSYHQHGPQLLAGSYGSVFTTDLLNLMNLV